jgi:hypothetical protein
VKIKTMKSKAVKKIPFDFVLDYLGSAEPVVKPMFGSYGVYIAEKIVLILRMRNDHIDANGVWLATSAEHHDSLRKQFPNMKSIYLLSDGKGETGWQMLPEDADDFESSVIKACALILAGDARIGKIPKRSKRRTNP